MRFHSSPAYRTLLSILLLLPLSLSAVSQPPAHKHADCSKPSPEETARKQTEMLVRDLDIKDSLLTDTIYHIHLRYAKLRQVSNTRAEHLERVQQMYAELRHVLSPEQYDRFMHQQIGAPRRPQSIGRMPQQNASPARKDGQE